MKSRSNLVSAFLIVLVLWVSLIVTGLIEMPVLYADVMDPKIPESTVVTTDPNTIQPNTPEITTVPEETTVAIDEELKERRQDRALHTGVVIMDSVMYCLGLVAIVVPMIITAFYLCARVNPAVFTRFFVLITLGKINHEEITAPQMLLRTIPIMVVGFFLATGEFRSVLSRFWFIITEKLGF